MPHSSFGLPVDLPEGEHIAGLVRIMEHVGKDPSILEEIKRGTTSCVKWGMALHDTMSMDLNPIVGGSGTPFGESQLEQMEQLLSDGKALVAHMKLPGGGDHMFVVESIHPERGEYPGLNPLKKFSYARIIQGWQDIHEGVVSKPIPIKEMIWKGFKGLKTLDWEQNRGELKPILERLFGERPAAKVLKAAENLEGKIKKIEFNSIHSGEPNTSFLDVDNTSEILGGIMEESRLSNRYYDVIDAANETEGLEQLSKHPNNYEVKTYMRRDGQVEIWEDVRSQISESDISENAESHIFGEGGSRMNATMGGAVLGFVLGAGAALYYGSDKEDAALAGIKAGLGGGAGAAAAAVVAENAVPTFSRLGVSVFRSNAAMAIVTTGVLTVWDVTEWKMHKITEVELRHRLAGGLGGAAGGAAGAGAGALVGSAIFPGVGTAIGGLIGGIIGGVSGAAAGGALDRALWDESEDSVMNSYDFFGWYNVKRNTRPQYPAKQIGKAFDKALQTKKPKGVKQEDWHKICLANFMVLLTAMYPLAKTLFQMRGNFEKETADHPEVGFVAHSVFNSCENKEHGHHQRFKIGWAKCSGGRFPQNAFVTGARDGNKRLFVARAEYRGSVTPGKLHEGHKACHVPFGGREHLLKDYEVLLNHPNLVWKNFRNGAIPNEALVTGRENNVPLYSVKGKERGVDVIGKYHKSYCTAYLPYDGKENEKKADQVVILCLKI